MRIAARALLCAAGTSLDEAAEAVIAGQTRFAQRESRPFGEMPLHGDWHQRLDTALQALSGALPALQGMPLFAGSSSWHIGAAGDPAGPDALAQTPSQFAESIAERLALAPHVQCFSNACVSSINALDAARGALAAGREQSALVLGIELDNAFTRTGFAALSLLSPTACKPCDAERDGLVLGEAIAALVCDGDAAAGWQLSGMGCVLDRSGPTSADPSGEPVSAAILAALKAARLRPQDIGLVKLHGAGSPLTEPSEAAGLRAVFSAMPPCVSLKGYLGHTLGASGAAELALLTACLDRGIVPATAGHARPDPLLGMVPTTRNERWNGAPVLALSIGFGGQVAAQVLELRR